MIRRLFFLILGLFFTSYLVWPSLNPFSDGMFGSHDPTQVGRVTSFVRNLKALQFPPRLAPEYSFGLGIPAFNFYAPTAYWITSFIVLIGFGATHALKISFLLAIMSSFVGMWFFIKKLIESTHRGDKPVNDWRVFFSALVGASVYVSSTYFATEIVVRGNLGETWFLGLLPFALGFVVHNSQCKQLRTHFFTIISLALLFTSHNFLSLIALPLVLFFLLLFPQRKKNLSAFFLALLLDSYFLIPAFLEGSLVHAATVAKEYNYVEHFLCAWQIWTAQLWAFGGSQPGCDADMMSFKIGKLQMILGFLGLGILVVKTLHKKKVSAEQLPYYYIAAVTLGSLFLTLYASQFVWDLLAPIMALFQFPWRFIAFGMFGIGVFAGYLLYVLPLPFRPLITVGLMIVLFLPGKKYFIKPLTSIEKYEGEYNSESYFHQYLTYSLREYVPIGVDYSYWRSLEPTDGNPSTITFDYRQPIQSSNPYQLLQNQPFYKAVVMSQAGEIFVNIHYFPFWTIRVNKQPVIPNEFDQLARPILHLNSGDTVEVLYKQTATEKISNTLSFVAMMLILFSVTKLRPSDILRRK